MKHTAQTLINEIDETYITLSKFFGIDSLGAESHFEFETAIIKWDKEFIVYMQNKEKAKKDKNMNVLLNEIAKSLNISSKEVERKLHQYAFLKSDYTYLKKMFDYHMLLVADMDDTLAA